MEKVAILGGDQREEILIKELFKKNYVLNVLKKESDFKPKQIFYSDELQKVVKNVDTVIAPLSGTDEMGRLKTTFINSEVTLDKEFFNLVNDDILLLIGSVNQEIKDIIDNKEIELVELASLDQLAIMNAIPTAEGAIEIAMEETDITIYQSNTLVLGLGKVGLTLAWRLKALGSHVYSATRNKGVIARGKDLGLEMVDYKELNQYLPQIDIIFNTVPALILDEIYLSKVKDDVFIIDLASSPGGTDFEYADDNNIRAMLAPGLPGKVAPVTAGKILGEIIPELISEYK